jgi:hypothetical protein
MTENTITLDRTDKTATALIVLIREEVRDASGKGKYAAYVTAHNVTRETVGAHAKALAVLAFPRVKVQVKDGVKTRPAGIGHRDRSGSAHQGRVRCHAGRSHRRVDVRAGLSQPV